MTSQASMNDNPLNSENVTQPALNSLSVLQSDEKCETLSNNPVNAEDFENETEDELLQNVSSDKTYLTLSLTKKLENPDVSSIQEILNISSRLRNEEVTYNISDNDKENISSSVILHEFYRAVDEGCPEKIEEITFKYNIDVNIVFSEAFPFTKRKHRGWSALHIAASQGNVKTVRFLITAGCDIEMVTLDGETAVHIAAKHGAADVVSYLLECNIFLRDRQNNQGATALLKAIFNSQQAFKGYYRRCVDLLLAAGCNPNIYSSSKVSALHVAVDKGDYYFVAKLLSAGANVNALCDRGSIPLMHALVSKYVNTDIVHALLLAGADTSFKTNGRSLLHIAVSRCDDRIIETFLEKGADPNSQDKAYKTPLWVAVEENNVKVVPILVTGGGDVNFLRSPQHMSLLSQAVINGSLPMVKLLLGLGATPYTETCMWSTPLHYAVEQQNINIVKELIRANSPLNTTSNAQYSLRPMTPVQLAIELGNVEISYLLLQAGSRLNWSWLREDRLSVAMAIKPESVILIQKFVLKIPSLLHLSRLVLREYLGERFSKVMLWMTSSGFVPIKVCSYLALSDILD